MGLLDWFRSPPSIVDRASLAEFLNTRAAFLVQKGIYDYARGRSGPYFKTMLNEEEFKTGVEESRWKSFPFSLAVVTEMVHGVLLPLTGDPVRLAAVLRDIALEVIDSYPVPAALGEEQWATARTEMVQRIEGIALHPPKQVKDIAIPFAKPFFDNMPIHEEWRKNDFEQIRYQLRVNLISMHRDFNKYADLPRLAAALEPVDA